ncbi:sugar phosphate isomerase/epimerase family protein [Aquimarina sediminis]|uniref:sugar phosphate isomerase/epimerase family protein n=1 Tax=Aquimarina sediminis TaxID=2070536 RepID=UPI000CA05E5C|nr:sugar phosphate isomerase/epimerase [Aquimarina sediminis]
MKLKFIYPRWGSADLKWSVFLKKVKDAGYDGIEIDLPLNINEKKEILAIISDHELEIVAQHWETKEIDFNKHKDSYKRHLYNLAEASPLLINSHTGMDFFTFKKNASLLQIAEEIEKETRVPIAHETHRSRFSFAAHVCAQYLDSFPDLKLTSDFSHWCCVAESMLDNQKETVAKAIKHSYHIHARVGSAQTPQVIDPREDRYKPELSTFIKWWKTMIDHAKAQQRSYITITPEYGPYPYATYTPNTNALMGDQWQINQFIKEELSRS